MSNLSRHDPILQKVETCNAAWAALGVSCLQEPSDGAGNALFGTPEYKRWDREQHTIGARWNDAFEKMVRTPPKTREGAAALIDCFLQCRRDFLDEEEFALLENLRTYLQSM